ncbi:hypothetical protein C0V76_15975 [Uliginosibacterium sp. TH139]|nr:hypothetical protein C0V76_15975 [Uliginosibacterium sp. TH139]
MQPLAPFLLFKVSDLLARHGRCEDHSATGVPSFHGFLEKLAKWSFRKFFVVPAKSFPDIDKADIHAATPLE